MDRAGLDQVVTTGNVLGETWTLLGHRYGHRAAIGFLDRVTRIEGVEIVHVDEDIETDAWRWLRSRARAIFT